MQAGTENSVPLPLLAGPAARLRRKTVDLKNFTSLWRSSGGRIADSTRDSAEHKRKPSLPRNVFTRP